MSDQKAQGSADSAANAKIAQQRLGDIILRAGTSVYQARYIPHEKNRVPGRYLVAFHPGHTLEKHFVFLGLEFEAFRFDFGYGDVGYGAEMEPHLVNVVRSDPRVEYVEESFYGRRD